MPYYDFDETAKTNEAWRQIIAPQLAASATFEIHCWSDETDEIALALRYGEVKPDPWAGGTVIEGPVTAAFVELLLTAPKPTDTAIYNKMTPFFTIHLDSGFWSEHYGTELNQED